MGRRRKGHGCAVTVLVLMLLLMAAGGAGGYIYMRKYNYRPYSSFITENYFIHRKVSQNIP